MKQYESERLYYRKFVDTDFDDVISILTDDEVCKYLPGNKGYPKEVVKKWHQFYMDSFDESKPNMIFGSFHKDTNHLVGITGIPIVDEFSLNEIKYILGKEYWGYGYATEMALMMKKICEEYKLKKVIALADVNNIPSNKVLVKIGYQFVKEMNLWGLEMNYYEMKLKD